jgi:hypothetical protein
MSLDEQDVRDQLENADIPLHMIDLGTVMRQGRSKRARRRTAEVAGGLALALALTAMVAVPLVLRAGNGNHSTSPAAPKVAVPAFTHTPFRDCTVSQLPLPSGVVKDFIPNVVDPSGRYIAAYQSSDTVWKTVLWTAGVPQVLSFPGTGSDVEGINSNGVVAGVTTVSKTAGEHVYRYANGGYTILQVPMSGRWHPYGVYINARGDIIANEEPADNTGGDGAVALLWKAGSDRAVKLPIPTGAEVFGITDNGNIVGTSPMGNLKSYAYVWDSSGHNGRKLQSPSGEYAQVDVISGNIGGGGTYPKGASSAAWDATVEWNLQTGEMTKLSNIVTGNLMAVNGSGWAADEYNEVDLGGVQANLLPLTPGDDTKNEVNAIADNGLVVGDVYNTATGTHTAVTWHC